MRNGNSRWDLLDVMRLVHASRRRDRVALREDGFPSFKLEHLAQANGTRTGAAHEALSDVYALIGLARKFRQAQPKLWDYALQLRDKRHAGSLLDTADRLRSCISPGCIRRRATAPRWSSAGPAPAHRSR